MKIPILDPLIGTRVTCIKTNGSTVGGVLTGVSHQDRWDVISIAGIPSFRSTDVDRFYAETEEGTILVWPEDTEDDSAKLAASQAAGQADYDPVLYRHAVGLLDRVVRVDLRDGREEIGRLEAVTPHVGPQLPTLHISLSLNEDDNRPVRVVQLAAVRSIGIHVLTHEETDALVVEEGQVEGSAPPTVEQQREKAEEAREVPQHSPEDTAKAFGITPSNEPEDDAQDVGAQGSDPQGFGPPHLPPEGANNSDTVHTHDGEEHDHEGGDLDHEHSSSEDPG